jgi:chromosome segregation ATPase
MPKIRKSRQNKRRRIIMNREEFKEKAKNQIDHLFEEIDNLEKKKDKAEDAVKSKYENQIEQLKEKKFNLQQKYTRLENAAEDKWDDAKEAFSEATDDFKAGLSKVGEAFS